LGAHPKALLLTLNGLAFSFPLSFVNSIKLDRLAGDGPYVAVWRTTGGDALHGMIS
jgi:hypothetical protein